VTVAYQGAPGAFGHAACLAFLPEHEARPLSRFEDVVGAVASGEAEFGMLPVENSRAGEVPGVRALIAGAGLRTVRTHVLPLRMHLLGLPGADRRAIAAVASHPVALRQCARSLDRLGLRREEAPNTAVAARGLRDPRKAVLASETAASLYGLEILERDMQDDPDNATLFALVARA